MPFKRVDECFQEQFGKVPELKVLAPGRINIMGEHTDYNLGYVLPAAIDYHIHLGFSKNGTNTCNVYALDFDEKATFELSAVKESKITWLNFVLGVVDQVKQEIGGFDLVFSGNIPVGAGLSSSAALCCGTIFGLNELFSLNRDKWQMAKMAQKSEHDFAHVNCGIMDQFACLFGLTNHALMLNCNTLEYEASFFDLTGYKFILVNSNVPHDLQQSAYNDRRRESSEAINFIRSKEQQVETYQDLSMDVLNRYEAQLDPVVYRRARHVVMENNRVREIKDALASKDFATAGTLLLASHESEKTDYEITCPETDFLVEELISTETVLGARQVGGGFGGCVLGLAKDRRLPEILSKLDAKYKKNFRLSITNIPIHIAKGCHILEE